MAPVTGFQPDRRISSAEVHPSAEELTAFALGTLGEGAQASIEAHVAA